MIELLILYTINKREKTIYSIRKDIIELFGTFTTPSIGTIYPALQRLLKAKAVVVNERMSDGGRKSSYFSITDTGLSYFKDLFFESSSENPSLFYNQLQARLGTMGLLTKEEKEKFVFEYTKKIDIFQFEIEHRLKDEFLELDYYQTQLLKRTQKEIISLKEYLKELKVN